MTAILLETFTNKIKYDILSNGCGKHGVLSISIPEGMQIIEALNLPQNENMSKVAGCEHMEFYHGESQTGFNQHMEFSVIIDNSLKIAFFGHTVR